MATYSNQLAGDAIDELYSLIDTRSASALYAPHLDVGSTEIWSDCFAFSAPVGGGYLRLGNEWRDTPKHFIDYQHLSVTRSPTPHAAARVENGLLSNTSMVRQWEGEAGRLASLSVLQYRQVVDDEDVDYDKALLFESVAGLRYALFAEGIAGGLRLTSSPDLLLRLTAATSVRACRRRSENGRGTAG